MQLGRERCHPLTRNHGTMDSLIGRYRRLSSILRRLSKRRKKWIRCGYLSGRDPLLRRFLFAWGFLLPGSSHVVRSLVSLVTGQARRRRVEVGKVGMLCLGFEWEVRTQLGGVLELCMFAAQQPRNKQRMEAVGGLGSCEITSQPLTWPVQQCNMWVSRIRMKMQRVFLCSVVLAQLWISIFGWIYWRSTLHCVKYSA